MRLGSYITTRSHICDRPNRCVLKNRAVRDVAARQVILPDEFGRGWGLSKGECPEATCSQTRCKSRLLWRLRPEAACVPNFCGCCPKQAPDKGQSRQPLVPRRPCRRREVACSARQCDRAWCRILTRLRTRRKDASSLRA